MFQEFKGRYEVGDFKSGQGVSRGLSDISGA